VTYSPQLGRLADAALDRLVVPGYSRIGYRVRRRWWPHDPAPDTLGGTVAVVTGAGGGLGLATAAGLARLGARVRLVVRDEARGRRAADGIAATVSGADLRVDRCDLSSLADVRRYAAELVEAEPRLRVLVHNAGLLPPERVQTDEGHEVTLATHVLGPLLLTELLRPTLSAGGGRVVFVSSGGMYTQRLHDEDPEYRTGTYQGATAYARTKRMQVVLTELLADRLADQGIVVHSCHPGWADTPGVAASLPGFQKLVGPLLRTPEQGADTTVWLAAADEPGRTTGRFWQDRAVRPTHAVPWTRETAAARERLWGFCLHAVRLSDQP
jgi:NAD(P)-dependent dehydrogenase (short-subunit alcohol dehydrogenase family)